MNLRFAPAGQFDLLDHIQDGVLVARANGKIVYGNQAARQMLGFAKTPGSLQALSFEYAPDDWWRTLLEEDGGAMVLATPGLTLHVQSRHLSPGDREYRQLIFTPETLGGAVEPVILQHFDSLQALSRISRHLKSTFNLEQIFPIILEETLKTTGVDAGMILLLEHNQTDYKLSSRYGETPPLSQVLPHLPQIKQIDIIELGAGFGAMQAAPIVYAEEIAGIFCLFASGTDQFDDALDDFLDTLTNFVAVAIGSAQRLDLIQERNNLISRRATQIERFVESSRVIHGEQSLDEMVEDMVYAIQAGVGFNAVLISLVENRRQSPQLRPLKAAGLPLTTLEQMQSQTFPWVETVEQASKPANALGRAFFISNQESGFLTDRAAQFHAILGDIHPAQNEDNTAWQPGDIFYIPMYYSDGAPLGVISLDEPAEGNRPDVSMVKALEIFANQTAVAVENSRLFYNIQDLVQERTKDLGKERDRSQLLLKIATELSSSLDEQHVLDRALELINEAIPATSGNIMLADPTTEKIEYRAIFQDEALLKRVHQIETSPSETALAKQVKQHRQSVLIKDAGNDPRWQINPQKDPRRSAIVTPLISGEEAIGVFMLFHEQPNAFANDQLSLLEAAASQVANALYNAQLYLLIRDQAERLGSMLREEQIEAAKNHAILQSIADGVLVADKESTVALANHAASVILDLEPAQLIGKSIKELAGLYGAAGNKWAKAIADWADNPQQLKQRTVLQSQLEIEGKIVSVSLSPVFASGQYFGAVSIFRDITKAVEVDRIKSEFVSTVSHELRTPMTSIKGYTDLMLMGGAGEMSESQKRFLDVIKNNADRMTDLVDDLLDISQIEAGKTELHFASVDVSKVINDIITHIEGRAHHEGKEIAASKELDSPLPMARADYGRMTQILTNLADNAFNYTPAGGSILIKVEQVREYIAIHISDTGIGIPLDAQDKIFDRFYRSDNPQVQAVAGTGLGLAIVNNLVEMHGGVLTVKSEAGKGSTFTVTLPIDSTELDLEIGLSQEVLT